MIDPQGDCNAHLQNPPQVKDKVFAEASTFFLITFKCWKEWLISGRDGPMYDYAGPGPVYHSHASSQISSHAQLQPNTEFTDLIIDLLQEDEIELGEPLLKNTDYVILPEQVWIAFQKWYNGRRSAASEVLQNGTYKSDHFVAEVYAFPGKIMILETGRQLKVKISKEETKAWELLNQGSEQIRIWDYFRKIKDLMSYSIQIPEAADREIEQEIHLEILLDRVESHHVIENGSVENDYSSVMANGASTSSSSTDNRHLLDNTMSKDTSSDNLQLHLHSSTPTETERNVLLLGSTSMKPLSGGLTGLQNLGNTCFMNSALQCLVHTPQLVEYFLQDYNREINRQNPLGMQGELAIAFGELLQKLWSSSKQPFAPRNFKMKLARFAPQFSGYNQHDSQELLAFLLDGLHEDLNRVKCKPYIELKDMEDRPEDEVANENWENHRKRNDSIIVDVCQGQYKSTLVCPVCNKVSITFDPFMYLSLPLPLTLTRTFSIKVFDSNGAMPPTSYTIQISKQAKWKDLLIAISEACDLHDNERLVLTERYGFRQIRVIEDLMSPVRDDGQITAHRLSKAAEKAPLIIFMNRYFEEESILKRQARYFGCPLVACLSDENIVTGEDLFCLFEKLIHPLDKQRHSEQKVTVAVNKQETPGYCLDENKKMKENDFSVSSSNHLINNISDSPNGSKQDRLQMFQFRMVEERFMLQDVLIEWDKSLPSSLKSSQKIQIAVTWSDKAMDYYNIEELDAVTDKVSGIKQRQETVSLYNCLEAFLKEEPLGPDDMWYCPCCKEHRQASKKLDLWRLPEILVVHLKRFSYSRYLKTKLETFVDFPIQDLDLTRYSRQKGETAIYELYAISNHYGSMGGGHYTAYVKLIDNNRWYNFDDSHVSSVGENEIKTSAAYVLFYRRMKRNK